MQTKSKPTPKRRNTRRRSSATCSATADELIIAFVQGAQWWEYQSRKATMWPSDRDIAELEAKCRASKGTLGKLPNVAHKPSGD
jgi:hypothetical protein